MQERELELRRDYAQVVSKLVLLLGAGKRTPDGLGDDGGRLSKKTGSGRTAAVCV